LDAVVEALTPREQSTILECLRAAETEEIAPEWEFATLFGISRMQLSTVRENWPDVDTHNPVVTSAVIGALNHMLGYPQRLDGTWIKHISVGPEAVKSALEKLLAMGI
jgi:hypothetical protein